MQSGAPPKDAILHVKRAKARQSEFSVNVRPTFALPAKKLHINQYPVICWNVGNKRVAVKLMTQTRNGLKKTRNSVRIAKHQSKRMKDATT